MVCGDKVSDVRIQHKGNIVDDVIDGAFRVLADFERVNGQVDQMKSLPLNVAEQAAFGRAALALKFDDATAPITDQQVLHIRRPEDQASDLWTTLNRTQENLMRGGLHGRNATGKRITTRPVNGIDQSIKLNRALWILADEMAKLVN